jgi:hypothetical protein
VQPDAHAVPAALHDDGAHDVVFGAQLPTPLHVFVVSVPAAHDVVGQSPCGSVPAAIGPHAPSAPLVFSLALHDVQLPVHAPSQQTPPAQKPLAHWPLLPHAAPLPPFAVQTPDAQYAVDTQSPSVAHVARHDVAVVSQT